MGLASAECMPGWRPRKVCRAGAKLPRSRPLASRTTLFIVQLLPLRNPVRPDLQADKRLGWIVGGHVDNEDVLAAHTLVHGKVRPDRCGLIRCKCRLTDDNLAWSTPQLSAY